MFVVCTNWVINFLFSICFKEILVNIYQIYSKMASNYNFANFRVNSIINNSTKNKTVCLVGNFIDINETDRALVILEKTAFTGLWIIDVCSNLQQFYKRILFCCCRKSSMNSHFSQKTICSRHPKIQVVFLVPSPCSKRTSWMIFTEIFSVFPIQTLTVISLIQSCNKS